MDGTGDCAIPDTTAYDDGEEVTNAWREVTLDHASGVDRGEHAMVYSQPAGHFETDFLAEWKVEDDVSRWNTVYDPPVLFSPGNPLHGVLWTHTSRSVVDPSLGAPDVDRELANHYWSGALLAAFLPPRAPHPCLSYIGPFLDAQPCLTCETAFPRAGLIRDLGLDCAGPIGGPELWYGDPRLEVSPHYPECPPDALSCLPDGITIEQDQWVEPDPGTFGGDPASILGHPGLIWRAVSEPVELLPETGIRYIGFYNVLEQIVTQTATGLGSAPIAASADCPFLPGGGLIGNRVGPLVVASARRGWIWMGAGHEWTPYPGQYLIDHPEFPVRPTDMWIYDGTVWHELALPAGLELPMVLAATYAPIEDVLYVISRDMTETRLLRLDPMMRWYDEIAVWPGSEGHGYAMTTDATGALFIVSSTDPNLLWLMEHPAFCGTIGGCDPLPPQPGSVHVVVRLERTGEHLRVTGVQGGPGGIDSPTVTADRRGITVFARDTTGKPVLVGHRTEGFLPPTRSCLGTDPC